jgi:hypothetical protein
MKFPLFTSPLPGRARRAPARDGNTVAETAVGQAIGKRPERRAFSPLRRQEQA